MTQGLKSTLMASIDTSGNQGTTGTELRNIVESAFIVDVSDKLVSQPITSDDEYCRIDTTNGEVVLTLPTLANARQQQYTFKWVAGANAASLDGGDADIEGSGTYVFADLGDAVIIRPGPVQWEIVAIYEAP